MYCGLPNPHNYTEEGANHAYGGTGSFFVVFVFGRTPGGQG